jgi:hypothetical protein
MEHIEELVDNLRLDDKSEDNLIIDYKKIIKKLILKIINKQENKYIHELTFFGNNLSENIKNLEIAHNIRQKQMKEGIIAQTIIGNFIGWEDLNIGHFSGLDCRKLDNSIILEIKNKYNTCNSNSQKTLLDKLADYKIKYPQTRCIWGIVNPKPNNKRLKETIIHNNVEIEKIQGNELFKLIFTLNNIDYSDNIINYVRSILY